ncbi:unnamed protein product [Mytilus edulis]|uniref:PHD-type domain-containing protein n=1 Tax=Mytilus edulis TaxID=6550 RepID=A0A8S3U0A1_MYTED|nr:unnamed protein product [Mytilus edulis]
MDPGDQNTSLEEFKTWKTDNLQHYLTMRGLTKEGTKDELVALCFSAAKLGQTCNHVASLLFKLESSNRYGMGACTSSACSWVVPKKVKDMQPKLLASMPPRKSNRSKSGLPKDDVNEHDEHRTEEITEDHKETEELLNPKFKSVEQIPESMEVETSLCDTQSYLCPICKNLIKESENVSKYNERSVGCDKCEMWFHFPCVKFTKTDSKKKTWFCPNCR